MCVCVFVCVCVCVFVCVYACYSQKWRRDWLTTYKRDLLYCQKRPTILSKAT